ncbi:hypothetical protein HK57_00687 [Aspergillus ustus]|uniref:Haloalkanoic acid dehalogenase n=1 Tax=Aspergillus ustus TaxID=40382 RepID=A0A0C1E5X5_ASPUT|nr:hypothetical protein HK57_00687 [Aspergillus ustus]
MTSLKSYKLLTFDVYGTLVDWEGGIIEALQPALSKGSKNFTKQELLHAYHLLEKSQQEKTPDMLYSDVLATIHAPLLANLGLPPPTPEESTAFGESIGSWPAFPDTVAALQRLARTYKLVVLSNVDKQSFAKTNAGSLCGVPFDLIITAQDIGSYKPALKNFEYMLAAVEREFGVKKEEVLQTAQSQFHDHHPAREVGIRSVWIERPGAVMGNLEDNIYDWRFETLGEMADAVEKEAE